MAQAGLKLTVGPFLGCDDTPALSAQDGKRAAAMLNFYAPTASIGGDCISRPGFTRIPFVSTITGTASKAGTTITGVGTAFLTQIAVGDILEISGTKMLVTVVTDNTTATASVSGTVASGAITRYAAGIVTGPIFGDWLYQNTDGTVKRYLIARTTSNLASRDAASRYTFLDEDSTATALTGTVSNAGAGFSNGSNTVNGSGTAFQSELEIGMRITFSWTLPRRVAGR